MIVVDSSVWIDMLRQRSTRQTEWLRTADQDSLLMVDLVLMEVLQGARSEFSCAGRST